MLKRVALSDVALGMYIHKLEGNWFSHPFWRAHFLLDDPDQLEKLRESAVPGVIIDTELGLDPDTVPAAGAPSKPAVATSVQRRPLIPNAQSLSRIVQPVSQSRSATPANSSHKVLAAIPGEVTRGFGRAQAVADRGLKVVSKVFLEMRLGKSIDAAAVTPLIESIIASVQSNPGALNGLLQVQSSNERAYRHAMATSALMISLGRTLRLGIVELHAAGLAGMLLDAGVSKLPHSQASDAFEPEKMPEAVWQSHVQLGYEFVRSSGLADNIALACLEHHERFDGNGWPNRSSGTLLSRFGRMAAICDAFDLMVAGSGTRDRVDPGEALRQMKSDEGAFDPELLTAFEASIGIWPTGSLVELRSGRWAVVVHQNHDMPDRPLVAVFFNPASGDVIDNLYIDLNDCYGADSIERVAALSTLPLAFQSIARSGLESALAKAINGPAKRQKSASQSV